MWIKIILKMLPVKEGPLFEASDQLFSKKSDTYRYFENLIFLSMNRSHQKNIKKHEKIKKKRVLVNIEKTTTS